MSNFEQIDDVLAHHLSLHQRLTDFYTTLSKDVTSPRVAMLLETLAGHEGKMFNELTSYRSQASSRLRNTYFQYTHEHSVDNLFQLPRSKEQLTTDDVFDISTEFDNYLAGFYDEMIDIADINEVKEMFVNLRAQVEEEKKRLSADMNGLMDM